MHISARYAKIAWISQIVSHYIGKLNNNSGCYANIARKRGRVSRRNYAMYIYYET